MKKIFMILAAILVASSTFAQTKEEINASAERAKQLTEMLDNLPKKTGLANVDACIDKLAAAADMAVLNSKQLENFYYREIGETKDGVTEVNVKKPTLDEIITLSESITQEGVDVAAAGQLVKPATDEIKGVKNPLQATKLASVSKYIADISKLLGEESVAQAKAIAAMVETAKSAANL